MPPTYHWRSSSVGSNDPMTEVTEYFRLYELDVTMNAEEGSVGSSKITADDPNATLDIPGHRQFRVLEDTATGSNQVIFAGYTADREFYRGDYHRTSESRVIDFALVDINSVLPRRIFDAGNANRPAETDVARITWLLTTSEAALIDDSRYVSLVDSVAMDAVDYRGQTVEDVIRDCSQQSGKDYFVWLTSDTDEFSLWYDFSYSSNYSSPLRLSNDLSDIDEVWTFPISADTKLRRDPSRVYSGIYLPYDGGFVYQQNQATASNFARRDASMPSVNVKTAARASARAARYLADLDTENDVITTSFYIPAAKVNFLMQGMRVQVKATHLPGYSDFTWMRCIMRNVRQVSELLYLVTVDLTARPPTPPAPPVYGILHLSKGPTSDVVYWGFPGDTPAPGYQLQPTTGLLDVIEDLTPPNASWPYTGWEVTGTGTVDVTLFASTVGVLIDDITYSITYAIRKNGVVQASAAVNVSGFLEFHSHEQQVVAPAISVAPGDVIDATITCIPPTMPFFRTPAGTGQNGERLEITGGTLV